MDSSEFHSGPKNESSQELDRAIDNIITCLQHDDDDHFHGTSFLLC